MPIQPFNQNHAIKSMAFALEFSMELEPAVFAELATLHPNFSNELPRIEIPKIIKVNLDSAQIGGSPQSTDIGGVIFDRLMPDGRQELALHIRPDNISFRCTTYSRWADMWQRANRVLQFVLPTIIKYTNIKAIGLQYVDRFIYEGSPNDFRADMLFQNDTKYLAPSVFELSNLWHSHHGYFKNETEPHDYTLHDNINVGVNDENNRRFVDIDCTHRAMLTEPSDVIDTSLVDNNENLYTYMNALHEINKDILRDLLKDDVKEVINLR